MKKEDIKALFNKKIFRKGSLAIKLKMKQVKKLLEEVSQASKEEVETAVNEIVKENQKKITELKFKKSELADKYSGADWTDELLKKNESDFLNDTIMSLQNKNISIQRTASFKVSTKMLGKLVEKGINKFNSLLESAPVSSKSNLVWNVSRNEAQPLIAQPVEEKKEEPKLNIINKDNSNEHSGIIRSIVVNPNPKVEEAKPLIQPEEAKPLISPEPEAKSLVTEEKTLTNEDLIYFKKNNGSIESVNKNEVDSFVERNIPNKITDTDEVTTYVFPNGRRESFLKSDPSYSTKVMYCTKLGATKVENKIEQIKDENVQQEQKEEIVKVEIKATYELPDGKIVHIYKEDPNADQLAFSCKLHGGQLISIDAKNQNVKVNQSALEMTNEEVIKTR